MDTELPWVEGSRCCRPPLVLFNQAESELGLSFQLRRDDLSTRPGAPTERFGSARDHRPAARHRGAVPAHRAGSSGNAA